MTNTSILSAFERMWQHVVASLSNKSDSDHNHDSRYYTEAEVDSKLSGKANTSHSHAISNVTNLQSSLDAKVPTSRTVNGKALSSNITLSASDVKADASGTASSVVSTHNTSTSAHSDIRALITDLTTKLNNFLDVDDTTTDQLSEVITLINNNKGTLESLTTSKINVSDIVDNLTTSSTSKVLSAKQGVAIKSLIDALQSELDSHTHAISDVSGLQSALDGKAASSHGTHVSYSTTAPKMDGTASAGSASTVARTDHVHPTDTSRAAQSSLDSHTGNTTVHLTSTERTNWNTAKTHADSAHAPSNAQANQNAFSNVKIGDTTIAADTTTDTLTLVGSNVTLTPDTTNDKVTIAVASGSTSTAGIVKLTNSTSSTSTTTAATPSSVKSAYDLANTAKTNAATAQTRADSAYSLAESKADSLSDLGITATATELNYVDGATSNIQSQINNLNNVINTLKNTLNYGYAKKNLIVHPYPDNQYPLLGQKTYTSAGITYTDNGDGTVTANGTATGFSFIDIGISAYNDELFSGNYTLSGCPKGGSAIGYYMYLFIMYVDEPSEELYDYGNGLTFEIQEGTYHIEDIYIGVNKGATVTDLVFRPQITIS